MAATGKSDSSPKQVNLLIYNYFVVAIPNFNAKFDPDERERETQPLPGRSNEHSIEISKRTRKVREREQGTQEAVVAPERETARWQI